MKGLRHMKPLKVAVIGGGILGVSAAEWLRRDGQEVTLIDRVAPGSDRQTSFGNAGMLARCAVAPVPVPGLLGKIPGMLLSKDSPLFVRWSYLPRALPWLMKYLSTGRDAQVRRIAASLHDILDDSVEQHRTLAAGTEAARYIEDCDYIYLYKDRAAYEGDSYSWNLRAEFGLNTRLLDRAGLEEQMAGLAPGYDFGAALTEHGVIRNPGAYVSALARHFESQGGRILQADVSSIGPEGEGVVVRAGGEPLHFDRVVLAAGAWSGRLVKSLGHEPALESERGYHIFLEGASHQPRNPVMVADGKFAMTPMEGGLRLAGLVEYGGLEAPPSKEPGDYLKRRVRRLFPDLTWKAESVWQGHRPSTADSLPFIGASPKLPQVYFAFGSQHIGLTSGPKTGRLIADLIGGRRPNIDLEPFRVGRFD